MGSWRRRHQGPAEIRRAYTPHYELAIAKRSAGSSVENTICPDAAEQRRQRLGFFTAITVRRQATDVMESGTDATQR
jgi:hypothetical protein